MKRLLVLLIITIPFLIAAVTNVGGSVGGFSSSMGDNNENCTKCHAGTAINKTAWISTNIPSSGYITGKTYKITVSGTHSGVVRFGFEATAEDLLGNKQGVISLIQPVKTKLVNSQKAITHTGLGYTPDGDNKSWEFNWKAPEIGTGDIIFSASLCAANGNMGTKGDQTYNSSITVTENPANSINNLGEYIDINIFPIPSKDFVNINFNDNKFLNYSVMDVNSKIIIENKDINSNEIIIDISTFSNGIYFIKFESKEGLKIIEKIVKN